MELELTEDDLNAYHTLATEPSTYEDDVFVRETVGPNPRSFAVSIVYIVVQCLMMLYMVRQLQGNFIHYFLFVFLFGVSLGFMLLLNKANPGVVRKNMDLQSYLNDATPATSTVMLNHRFIQRWCVDCRIYKPPRVKHCYECDRCISRFDHHCQWLSNCIGGHNYKLFVLFAVHHFLTMWLSLFFTFKVIKGVGFFKGLYFKLDLWLSFAQYETAIFITSIIFCFNALVATYALLVQANLIANNSTYYEYAAKPYGGRNPFNQGVMNNIQDFLSLPFELTTG